MYLTVESVSIQLISSSEYTADIVYTPYNYLIHLQLISSQIDFSAEFQDIIFFYMQLYSTTIAIQRYYSTL